MRKSDTDRATDRALKAALARVAAPRPDAALVDRVLARVGVGRSVGMMVSHGGVLAAGHAWITASAWRCASALVLAAALGAASYAMLHKMAHDEEELARVDALSFASALIM